MKFITAITMHRPISTGFHIQTQLCEISANSEEEAKGASYDHFEENFAPLGFELTCIVAQRVSGFIKKMSKTAQDIIKKETGETND